MLTALGPAHMKAESLECFNHRATAWVFVCGNVGQCTLEALHGQYLSWTGWPIPLLLWELYLCFERSVMGWTDGLVTVRGWIRKAPQKSYAIQTSLPAYSRIPKRGCRQKSLVKSIGTPGVQAIQLSTLNRLGHPGAALASDEAGINGCR